jgi:hypothetical protein
MFKWLINPRKEPELYTLVVKCNINTLENCGSFLDTHLLIQLFLGIYQSEKTNMQIRICTWMFIAALFTIIQKWNQPNVHQLMSGWIEDGLTVWLNIMNLDSNMLSERSKSQRTIHCFIPIMWNVHNRQIYRDKLAAKECEWTDWEWEEWDVTTNGKRFISKWWKCSKIRLWWRLCNYINMQFDNLKSYAVLQYVNYVNKAVNFF